MYILLSFTCYSWFLYSVIFSGQLMFFRLLFLAYCLAILVILDYFVILYCLCYTFCLCSGILCLFLLLFGLVASIVFNYVCNYAVETFIMLNWFIFLCFIYLSILLIFQLMLCIYNVYMVLLNIIICVLTINYYFNSLFIQFNQLFVLGLCPNVQCFYYVLSLDQFVLVAFNLYANLIYFVGRSIEHICLCYFIQFYLLEYDVVAYFFLQINFIQLFCHVSEVVVCLLCPIVCILFYMVSQLIYYDLLYCGYLHFIIVVFC